MMDDVELDVTEAEFDYLERLPLFDPDVALFDRLNGRSRMREMWLELGEGE